MARPQPGGIVGASIRIALFLVVSVLSGLLVAGLLLPLVGSAGAAVKTVSQDFENLPSILRQPVLPQQTKIYTADGKLLATIYGENRIVVPLKSISPLLQQAIVAVEDNRFYQHHGVDVHGLARALVTDLEGKSVEGGSTITQQYVKNVLVATATTDAGRAEATARTPARKLREMRLALGLEEVWTKQQILEGYLNIVYFGHGAYGAEAASLRYFGVHASQVTLGQAATLAGLVQSPVSYDPLLDPALSTKRRNVVLSRMFDQGIITGQAYYAALAVPMSKLTARSAPPPNGCTSSIAAYFCNYVLHVMKSDSTFGKTQADRDALLAQGGLTIRTTLNSVAQATAQAALFAKVPATDKHGAAISVVQPGTGNIEVMAQNRIWGTKNGNKYTTYNYNVDRTVGGYNFNGVGFQTGSTFKPFVLAAALEQKIPVNEVINAPDRIQAVGYTNCAGQNVSDPGAWIYNDEGHGGKYNLLTATAQSVNTAFMLIEKQTGLCRPAQIAAAMGIRRADGSPLAQVPSMTLGVNPIAPLRMAEAYASFAAHGLHCAARAILSITNKTGRAVPVPPLRCGQVIEPAIADGVTAILEGVMTNGTGVNMAFNHQTAGKTGTTDGHVNVWFCGYTVQLAAAAWVGDPTGSANASLWSMAHVVIGGQTYAPAFGLNLPGPIWKTVMMAMEANLPFLSFNRPDPSVLRGFSIKVPDVTGLSLAAAMKALSDAGLVGQPAPTSVPSPTVPKGEVSSTNPSAGSSVPTGTAVTIYISSGKPPPPPPTTSPTPTPTGSPSPSTSPTH
jgi:membrane peptidoglycan carboxypeptidase